MNEHTDVIATMHAPPSTVGPGSSRPAPSPPPRSSEWPAPPRPPPLPPPLAPPVTTSPGPAAPAQGSQRRRRPQRDHRGHARRRPERHRRLWRPRPQRARQHRLAPHHRTRHRLHRRLLHRHARLQPVPPGRSDLRRYPGHHTPGHTPPVTTPPVTTPPVTTPPHQHTAGHHRHPRTDDQLQRGLRGLMRVLRARPLPPVHRRVPVRPRRRPLPGHVGGGTRLDGQRHPANQQPRGLPAR